MRVLSKLRCGFKQDGSALLQEGDNHLVEPLTLGERAFIDALVSAKLVEIVSEPEAPLAPVSETKIKAKTKTPTRVGAPPKKAMRLRRASK